MSDVEQLAEQLTVFERKVRVPAADTGENTFRIPPNDPLLTKLYKEHPERRYESLQFPEKIISWRLFKKRRSK